MNLLQIPTTAPEEMGKKETKDKLDELQDRLKELQNLMYAEGKHSLLVVLQGMDASGKDGVVKKVLEKVNAGGIHVAAFKKPTEEEMAHDFLWRVHKHVPRRGMISVFNRSHYEDVLICRVKGWVSDELAHKRFGWINAFEETLQERDTHIFKFYLHISEAVQNERFEDRRTDPRKHWKFNSGDLVEAQSWPEYRKMYQDVFEHCGPKIPWTIIPSDDKWYKEYLIAKILVEHLESLNMQYPPLDES